MNCCQIGIFEADSIVRQRQFSTWQRVWNDLILCKIEANSANSASVEWTYWANFSLSISPSVIYFIALILFHSIAIVYEAQCFLWRWYPLCANRSTILSTQCFKRFSFMLYAFLLLVCFLYDRSLFVSHRWFHLNALSAFFPLRTWTMTQSSSWKNLKQRILFSEFNSNISPRWNSDGRNESLWLLCK